MFLELLLGLLTLAIIWDYLRKKRQNDFFQRGGIGGPIAMPIFGNAYNFLKETPETMFTMMARLAEVHGKSYRMWVMHEPTIVTLDTRLQEAVLSSQQVIKKNQLYTFLNNWLGDGLLLSTGAKWHARRKIITPTFHFKILEQFVEIFDQQSAIMMQKLTLFADGKTLVNIFPIVCSTALDIIAETAMGVKINAQLQPNFPYVQAVRIASQITAERLISPSHRYDFFMRLTAPHLYKELQRNIALMHDFTDKVIQDRRAQLEANLSASSEQQQQEDDVGAKKRMAFLDVLLQSTVQGKPLTNADIREEVDTFMFEGHDTTTSGISFTCYLIARHPEVQQKLFQEIRDVIGDDKERPVTMRDLQELKYLELVIKESMRLYPPVPLIGRQIERDVILNGIAFPAKTNILMGIYHALRDPENFSNPNDFIPERFNAENNDKIDPFAYVPFSAGPRNCIGQKFAMLEMKSTVSKLLRHYELLPLGEPVRLVMNLILRSANGVGLGLKPRVY